MHCYKDYGGVSYWVGDGFCDDINNNEACEYDDGDCCGLSMKKNFCVQCTCKGKSNSFEMIKENWINHCFSLVFTCKNDKDCYGNGYCHARQCKCLANYEYAQDCSHHGCKYIKQTFVFHSTPTPWLTLLLVLRKSHVNQISC